MQLTKNNTAVIVPTIMHSCAARGTAAATAGTSRALVQNTITMIVESAVNMVRQRTTLLSTPARCSVKTSRLIASQVAAGADPDIVAVQMSNNISTSVHLAAVNIGSLTAAGTNTTILGGADALTTSAVICGIDVRKHMPP